MFKLQFVKIFLLTSLALSAFAANSVLCRLALLDALIDPLSFTAIRLISGALMLGLLVAIVQASSNKSADTLLETTKQSSQQSNKQSNNQAKFSANKRINKLNVYASLALFIYAICFSIAYIELSTGSGALILFAAVQITLTGLMVFKGYRLSVKEWLGITLAFAGFSYLIWPAISTPSIWGFALMQVSGIAWGIYTYLGLNAKSPLLSSYTNFFYSIFFVICSLLIAHFVNVEFNAQSAGIWLALISGAITSGLGYFIWYAVLPHFNSTQAGVLQLSVPLLATIGGTLFVNEAFTLRMLIATCLILTGILFVILSKRVN